MDWNVTYRKGDAGEIEAVVEAESREEAIEKFLRGDVKSVEVNYWALHADQCEVEPKEE